MPTVRIDRSAAWKVKALVGVNRLVRWSIRTTVGKSRQIICNVQSILPKVKISREIISSLKQTVGINVTANWRVDAVASSLGSQTFVARTNAIRRLFVDYFTIGQARVTWELAPHFFEPSPHTFQLQVGFTGLGDANDWQNVGSPVVDTFTQTDTTTENTRRWLGKSRNIHYRVVLTTANSKTFYSPIFDTAGNLSWRDWRLSQEIVRKEKLRHIWQTSVSGYLLKQKRGGSPCPRCIDIYTETTQDSRCTICYGTRWVGGYFKPLPLSFADLGLEQSTERISRNGLGMERVSGEGPLSVQARFIASPQLYDEDIWVNKSADIRYRISGLAVAAHVRGVPIIINTVLNYLPPDDVAYLIPLT